MRKHCHMRDRHTRKVNDALKYAWQKRMPAHPYIDSSLVCIVQNGLISRTAYVAFNAGISSELVDFNYSIPQGLPGDYSIKVRCTFKRISVHPQFQNITPTNLEPDINPSFWLPYPGSLILLQSS